ncbi:hypothetical protein FCM35_KLT10521 [Carex littledalei]|uniref:Uncharacterized protein n=1 Tax=Carex littledalei TaxID=544730 RepID=A0A833QEY4_9POAL|nr:hypothetical protein FCM35_KLT10521 [Carex littledalei]
MERGINFLDNVDIDEELRYSAVARDRLAGWQSRESQTDSWRRPTETQSDSWRSHQGTQNTSAISDYENESVEALGSANVDTPLDLSTSSSVVLMISRIEVFNVVLLVIWRVYIITVDITVPDILADCGGAINQLSKGRNKEEESSELPALAAEVLTKEYKKQAPEKLPLVAEMLKNLKLS